MQTFFSFLGKSLTASDRVCFLVSPRPHNNSIKTVFIDCQLRHFYYYSELTFDRDIRVQ